MSRPSLLLGAVLSALACAKPPVAPGLDQLCDGGPCAAPGVIQGSFVYSGPARGDGIVFLFDTQSLPPPDGTGASAVAIARVPAATLFGGAPAGSVGSFSAPYIFTQVPSGRSYQVRAFLDTTGDFDPFFDFTQQPRAGDPAGGHGELVGGQPRLAAVAVAAGQVLTDVNVALTQVVPYDPPSFVLTAGSQTLATSIDRPVRLQLSIARLDARNASFANAHFGLELDRDAQGNRQSTAGDGLDDVFPRVFLRQLTQQAGTPVAAGAAAIVPCRAIALPVLPALVAAAPGAAPVARDTLDVLVEPLAVSAADFSPLPKIPAGTYQVIVVEKTGQVWTLPNQLGDPARAGTPYFAASQAQVVTFAAPAALPEGAVSGNVVFHGDPSIKSGNIIVQAYAALPFAPPPPLGAAQPVRVQIIRAAAVAKTGDGFTAPYLIDGLPPGNYVVQALDDVDGNFSPLNLLATPTKGDLVGAVLDTATLRPAVIAVSGAVSGQEVTLSPQPIPFDPPAFEIDPATPAQMPADQVTPVRFDLRAQPLAFPAGAVAAPHFAVQLVRDSGGAAVDADHDGLADVWPRVFLVRLDSSDPTGLAQYASGDPQKTLTQLIPAAIDPTPFLTALQPEPGASAPPVLTDRVTVVVRPTLLDATDPLAAPRRLPSLQPGAYKIVLVEQTGQIWQIPNEAGSAALDARVVCAAAAGACAAGTLKTQSQSQAFQVGLPAHAIYSGAIAGTLTAPAPPVAAWVFAYAAAALPPFGAPVSADFHLGAEFSAGAVGYVLPDLPTGDYLVFALADTRGDFAASPALFALAPGAGTLLASPQAVHVGIAPVTGVDLAAASAAPPRPSFQIVDGAGSPLTADATVTFAGAPAASLRLAPVAVLSGKVSPLAPDSAASFLFACDGSGTPIAASLAVELLEVADPAGLTPALDPATFRGTVVPAAVDQAQFTAGSCAPGGFLPVTGPVKVNLSNGSAKVDLLNPAVAPAPEALVPGRYAVVVRSVAKQVWRVPNELQPALIDPAAYARTPPDVQSILQSQQVAVDIAP